MIDKYPTIDYISCFDDLELYYKPTDSNNAIQLRTNGITDIQTWITYIHTWLTCIYIYLDKPYTYLDIPG